MIPNPCSPGTSSFHSCLKQLLNFVAHQINFWTSIKVRAILSKQREHRVSHYKTCLCWGMGLGDSFCQHVRIAPFSNLSTGHNHAKSAIRTTSGPCAIWEFNVDQIENGMPLTAVVRGSIQAVDRTVGLPLC